MSARSALELVLLRYFSGKHITRASAGELERLQANGFIDAFAHELAERQRGFAEQEDALLRSTSATVYVQGIRDAADLIDPMKEGDRG